MFPPPQGFPPQFFNMPPPMGWVRCFFLCLSVCLLGQSFFFFFVFTEATLIIFRTLCRTRWATCRRAHVSIHRDEDSQQHAEAKPASKTDLCVIGSVESKHVEIELKFVRFVGARAPAGPRTPASAAPQSLGQTAVLRNCHEWWSKIAHNKLWLLTFLILLYDSNKCLVQ